MILAYADNLLVIAEEEKEVEQLLDRLTPNLRAVGMELNLEKSAAMIRDPKEIKDGAAEEIQNIGKYNFKKLEKVKYLGVNLTSKLDRPEIVKQGIMRAHRAARMILPLIQQHKIPKDIKKVIYNSIITPTALYGLKTSAITKANKNSLRKMERKIIRLLQLAPGRNSKARAHEILSGRTITRKLRTARIKYWGHIMRRAEDHPLKLAYTLRAEVKKVGRPCYTWNRALTEDIESTGILQRRWEEWAKNKTELKRESKRIYEEAEISDQELIEEEEEEEGRDG